MDWQEGSARVRLQSEAFSFSETQDLMRPILKLGSFSHHVFQQFWWQCTVNYMHLRLTDKWFYAHQHFSYPDFFIGSFHPGRVTEPAPPCCPLAYGCSVVSLILPSPSSCLGAPGTAPLALGQPSKRHCLFPPSGEKVAGGIPAWPKERRCFPPQSCTEVNPQEQDVSKHQFLTS